MSFAMKAPRFVTTYGVHGTHKASYILSSNSWDHVHLSNGSALLKMPGWLHITGIPDDAPKWERLGAIHFLKAFDGSSDGVIRPSPESFSVECGIPLTDLKELISAERAGRGPDHIQITVSGAVSYGWAPDGSDMNWDISESDYALVEALSIVCDRAEPADHADAIDAVGQPEILPSNEPAMLPMTDSFDRLSRKLIEYGRWVIALLVAIWIAVALK